MEGIDGQGIFMITRGEKNQKKRENEKNRMVSFDPLDGRESFTTLLLCNRYGSCRMRHVAKNAIPKRTAPFKVVDDDVGRPGNRIQKGHSLLE